MRRNRKNCLTARFVETVSQPNDQTSSFFGPGGGFRGGGCGKRGSAGLPTVMKQ